MGQSSSRTTGQPPTLDDTPHQGTRNDTDIATFGNGNGSTHLGTLVESDYTSARLPREGNNSASHASDTFASPAGADVYSTTAQHTPSIRQSLNRQLSAPAPALTASRLTPPADIRSALPRPASFCSPAASTSKSPATSISLASHDTSNILGTSASNPPHIQDDSASRIISEDHNVKTARPQRQTLADRLRSVRRRSSQRLSWALSGGQGSTDAPTNGDQHSRTGTTTQQEHTQARESSQPWQSTSSRDTAETMSTPNLLSQFNTPQSTDGRDPWRVMTPPPDEDLMFEERQRARRMVEEALAQLQTELARPNSSHATSSERLNHQERTAEALAPDTNVPQVSTIHQRGLSSMSYSNAGDPASAEESEMQVDRPISPTSAEPGPRTNTPGRLMAPLPRRSASRSTSPSATTSPAVEAVSSVFNDLFPNPTLPPSPGTSSAAAAPQSAQIPSSDAAGDFMIPRRILVQGIVSSSPPPPPALLSSRSAVSSSSRPSVNGNMPDTALWDELPGMDAVSLNARERRNSDPGTPVPMSDSLDDGDENQAWENAISAALEHRTRDAIHEPARMLQDQANLIGRLLCVAAAATAATLIPGITVNGSPVAGFGESQGGDILGSTGISPTSAPSFPRTAGHAGVTGPRRDSLGTFRSPGGISANSTPSLSTDGTPSQTSRSPPSSTMQDILRNALAAAFRSPGSSSSSSDSSDDPIGTPLAEAPSSRGPMASSTMEASNHPSSPSLPTSSPPEDINTSARPPQSRRNMSSPFGQGAALAIPVASLQSGLPYVSGNHHSPGTFERFLADLQADVSVAITRSRQASNAAPSSSTNVQPRRSNTGLEEMRPLLDDIDEVTSDETPQQPPREAANTSEHATTATQPTRQRQPFSFFRSYRFPSRALDDASNNEIPASTPQPSAVDLRASAPSEDIVMEGDAVSSRGPVLDSPRVTSARTAESSEDTGRTGTGVSHARPVVPMLLVGVRSASLSGLTGVESNDSPANSADNAQSAANADNSTPPANPDGAGDSTDHTANRSSARTSGERDSSGFVLWILGGLYPANHPIVVAPSLLGDDAMSYEELLRLAEVLGNVKPPTVSKEDIRNSDLKIVKSETISDLYADGAIREITSERCLVCLEDYEPEEDIRILNCKHCFHQACVDTWLSTGANTCPACRTVGVAKDGDPPAAEIPPPAAV